MNGSGSMGLRRCPKSGISQIRRYVENRSSKRRRYEVKKAPLGHFTVPLVRKAIFHQYQGRKSVYSMKNRLFSQNIRQNESKCIFRRYGNEGYENLHRLTPKLLENGS